MPVTHPRVRLSSLARSAKRSAPPRRPLVHSSALLAGMRTQVLILPQGSVAPCQYAYTLHCAGESTMQQSQVAQSGHEQLEDSKLILAGHELEGISIAGQVSSFLAYT